MERDRAQYEGERTQFIEESKVGRTLGVISGVLIGLGVGGWVALGMDPIFALGLGLAGAKFGLIGALSVVKRKYSEDTGIYPI